MKCTFVKFIPHLQGYGHVQSFPGSENGTVFRYLSHGHCKYVEDMLQFALVTFVQDKRAKCKDRRKIDDMIENPLSFKYIGPEVSRK